jgi:hypothetical protein
MNTFWGEVVFELMTGVLASFIFLFVVLFYMRPSIRISNVIVKQVNTFDDETQYTFVFKLINRSWFNAYEIQIELFEASFYPAYPKGLNKKLSFVPLKCNHLKHIPAYKRLRSGALFADHCITFRTNTDLQSLLENESKAVILQVTLKHGLQDCREFM